MSRITAIDPATATGKNSELFAAVKSKLGMVPNLMRTFGQSPTVLEAYLGFSGTLATGAQVALNILTNYTNNVAQTAVDFPKVAALPVAV